MASIKIEIVHEFKGDTVLLVAMDQDGLRCLLSTIIDAEIGNNSPQKCIIMGIENIFINKSEAADIELGDKQVRWLLSQEKQKEIINKLIEMNKLGSPCHNYVDISTPVSTLFLAVGEYL
jgi:hypothetical protein